MPIKINTNMFNFYKEDNSFSQELSSLSECSAVRRGVPHDFVLVSGRTGAEVPFTLDGVEQSDEGEIQCWNFKAQSPFQILQDMTLTIFND